MIFSLWAAAQQRTQAQGAIPVAQAALAHAQDLAAWHFRQRWQAGACSPPTRYPWGLVGLCSCACVCCGNSPCTTRVLLALCALNVCGDWCHQLLEGLQALGPWSNQ